MKKWGNLISGRNYQAPVTYVMVKSSVILLQSIYSRLQEVNMAMECTMFSVITTLANMKLGTEAGSVRGTEISHQKGLNHA